MSILLRQQATLREEMRSRVVLFPPLILDMTSLYEKT